MATPLRQLHVALYQEHLEEASFLYEQRLAHLHDPEVDWPDLQDLEERFEAHIDALVLGGELALSVCRQQAAAGDTGEMHAALRVLCRQNRKDAAFAMLGELDPTDQVSVRAAAQAICREAPAGWRDDLLRAFQDDQRHLTHMLAWVIGYRRFSFEDVLNGKLAQKPSVGSAELAWALGRVGSARSVPLLRSLLASDDACICEAAAIALMRLGDNQPLRRAMEDASTQGWARRVLAIGGDSRAVRLLIGTLQGESADADSVLALGLLGDLAAVAPLLDLLGNEDLSLPAAVALNAITGAELYARVFVPDDVDPDELQGQERDAYDKDGTLPTRLGEPYGNWERRPLLDKAGWHAWLEQNKHRFSRDRRWRMGSAHGPAALFQSLRSAASPYAVRAATYEELVVRYGLDVPFEVDLPVSQQLRVLAKIEDWVVRQTGDDLEEGRWYFAGSLQE